MAHTIESRDGRVYSRYNEREYHLESMEQVKNFIINESLVLLLSPRIKRLLADRTPTDELEAELVLCIEGTEKSLSHKLNPQNCSISTYNEIIISFCRKFAQSQAEFDFGVRG